MDPSLEPYPAYKDSGTAWLGEIPAHWSAGQLGRFGGFFKGNGGTKSDEVPDGVPCIRYGDIYTQHQFFAEASRSCVSTERARDYTPIRYGDILFAGSGETIEEIGKSVACLIRSRACCGGDVIVFRPSVEVDARFMGYATDCGAAASQKSRMGRGITVMHLYGDQLKYMWIALPPLTEQTTIAHYLDRETARIDALVERKQRLVELLQEKRVALISNAVTKGLDPDVPMGDSGAEWIGRMPSHWAVHRLFRIAKMESGHTPDRQRAEFWMDCDIPWVSLNDTKYLETHDYIEETRNSINALGLAGSSARMLPQGTVVFSRDATIGRCGIAPIPLAVSQHFIAWVCEENLLPEYLLFVLRSMTQELERHTMGSTLKTIGLPDVKRLVVPLPPIGEQRAIVEWLGRETQVIDSLSAKVTEVGERLREYRSAVITAAVTGHVEVTDPGLRRVASEKGA